VSARARERGFTLLELLITLSVTTIGLVGLLSLHVSVARGNDGASRAAEAQQLCASELEALRAMKLSELAATLNGGNPTLVLPSTRVQTLTGRNLLPFTVTSSVAGLPSASSSLIRIRVVAQWAEDGATFGSNGGAYDHQIALEVIRTLEEAL